MHTSIRRLCWVEGFAARERAGDGAGEETGVVEEVDAVLLFRGVGRAAGFLATAGDGAEQLECCVPQRRTASTRLDCGTGRHRRLFRHIFDGRSRRDLLLRLRPIRIQRVRGREYPFLS